MKERKTLKKRVLTKIVNERRKGVDDGYNN